MTIKQKALKLAQELNVTIFRESDRKAFQVDAPYGYIFKGSDLHYMVCFDWQDIIGRIGGGLELCTNPECDVCHPEGEIYQTSEEYAEYFNYDLILGSNLFNRSQMIAHVTQNLANAYVTFCRSNSNHECRCNEGLINNYKDLLTTFKTAIPSDEYLSSIGIINGEGSF